MRADGLAENLIDYRAADAGFKSRDCSVLLLQSQLFQLHGAQQAVELKMPSPKDPIAFTEALADVTRL